MREDSEVISLIKRLAINITSGVEDFEDLNIIILSNVVVIPEELEKYMTILSMDYLTQDEIKGVVNSFCEEMELESLRPQFLDELSLAFKGLSELEINNILAFWLFLKVVI